MILAVQLINPGMTTQRVTTYNIRAGLGSDLKRNPKRVLETIASHRPDIAILQEADFRLGPRPSALPLSMIATITGLKPAQPNPEGPSLGWHGNAFLVSPDWTLETLRTLDLPGLEPRGALIGDFTTPIGALRVVGIHLGLIRRHRRAQLAALNTHLDSYPPRPTIIGGDFNEWSTHKGLDPLKARYHVPETPKTFPSTRPLGRLDRFAHCAQLKSEVLPTQDHKGPHPSDHRPLSITLTKTVAKT